jgi:hypothetical protein
VYVTTLILSINLDDKLDDILSLVRPAAAARVTVDPSKMTYLYLDLYSSKYLISYAWVADVEHEDMSVFETEIARYSEW